MDGPFPDLQPVRNKEYLPKPLEAIYFLIYFGPI